jgi:hypothetical protein
MGGISLQPFWLRRTSIPLPFMCSKSRGWAAGTTPSKLALSHVRHTQILRASESLGTIINMEPISEPLLTGEAFYTFMLASPYAPPRLPHSERGTRFTTAGCARLLERAAEIKVHPHMLRHACGFKLANDGKDTRSLQAYNDPIIATRHPLAHPGFPDAAYSNGRRGTISKFCARRRVPASFFKLSCVRCVLSQCQERAG